MNKPNIVTLIPDNAKVGVEVGVMRGETSEMLLHFFPELKLYMVDPWDMLNSEYFQTDSKFYRKHGGSKQWYEDCKKIARRYPGRAILLREFSHIASYQFNNDSLDFVFIDGDHSYPAVYTDLLLWYPKIKPGGMLILHDYGAPQHIGVYNAYIDFANKYGLKIHTAENTLAWSVI